MIVDLFRVDFMAGRGAPPSKNFTTFFGIIRVMSMTAIIPAAGLGTVPKGVPLAEDLKGAVAINGAFLDRMHHD